MMNSERWTADCGRTAVFWLANVSSSVQAGLWDYEYELLRWPDNSQQQTGVPSLLKAVIIEPELICCVLTIQATLLFSALIMETGGNCL